MSEAATVPTSTEQKCAGCGTPLVPGTTVCPTCHRQVDDVITGPVPSAEEASAAGEPSAEPTTQKDLALGDLLMGQWQLESKLGEGSLGNVFLATELKLGRKVAVKALSSGNLQEDTVKRFEREAQVMAKLDHPNVVTLYAVGRHKDIPFFAMRYLEGGSLWDLLDAHNGRLTPELLLPLVKQLCSALGYIHGKGLTHRDLKPSNVFVSPTGKVTVLDLGLARGHSTTLARSGVTYGAPEFMAPEQIVGEKLLDGRCDLYVLGVVLYRMMANVAAFPEVDEQAQLRAHLTRPRPDLSQVWSGASAALSQMLQKAMAIKPEERFQTADEFATAFERAISERTVREVASAPSAEPAPSLAPAPSVPPDDLVFTAADPEPRTVAMDGPPQPDEDDRTAVGTIDPATLMALKSPDSSQQRELDEAVEISQSDIVLEKSGILKRLPPELGAAPPEPTTSMASDAPPLSDEPVTVAFTGSPAPAAAAGPPPASAAQLSRPGIPEADLGDDDRTAVGFLPPMTDPGGPPPTLVTEPSSGVLAAGVPATTRDRPLKARAEFSTLDDEGEDPKTEIAAPVRTLLDGVSPLAKTGESSGPVIVSPPSASGTPGRGRPVTSTAAIIKPPSASGTPAHARPITANAAIVKPPSASGTPSSARPVGSGPNVSAPRPRRGTPGGGRRVAAPPAPPPPPPEEALVDAPPWMHPYVLVVGGLLLLALGFLIGVLLR